MGDLPAKSHLPAMLQAAVQSVRWTYSIFWQLCPHQGVLVWRDGYYNGAIKTRKTVQPTEVSTEEATLQRSQQLRELYECLSSAGHQPQRPSTALSPEDLTESEWFYLICVSFSFTPGLGLPGKAYVKRNHIWLTRADEADSKFFSRAILAKSARIKTVVCFPLLDGVVEFGTIEKVEENIDLIQRVKSFFKDCRNPNPRLAVSQHSTSNPPTSPTADFQSPVIYAPPHNVLVEEEEEEEEEDEVKSDSDFEDQVYVTHDTIDHEAMQLDIYVDTKLGSPHDSSNNLDSDFHHLTVSRLGSSSEHRWPLKHPTLLTPRLSGILSPDVLALDDTNYSRTLGNILQSQCSASPSMSSATSAFRHWSSSINHTPFRRGASQWTLKYILFTVPHLPTKHGWLPHDDLGGSHVLAERRRREKLNERFVVLRSLVPFVTKMDKASILGDTIEYLKQLRRRIKELESERSPVGREKQKAKVVESPVEVSIIENDALVEIECVHREGLLLDAMQVLGDLGIKVITVQSSIHDGVFAAHFRAKVQLGNVSGRKPSIMEVKRSINRMIRHQ